MTMPRADVLLGSVGVGISGVARMSSTVRAPKVLPVRPAVRTCGLHDRAVERVALRVSALRRSTPRHAAQEASIGWGLGQLPSFSAGELRAAPAATRLRRYGSCPSSKRNDGRHEVRIRDASHDGAEGADAPWEFAASARIRRSWPDAPRSSATT